MHFRINAIFENHVLLKQFESNNVPLSDRCVPFEISFRSKQRQSSIGDDNFSDRLISSRSYRRDGVDLTLLKC